MNANIKSFTQFLSKNFFIPEQLILPWKRLRADLGLNSIEFLEVIVHVENTYGIDISDPELEKIDTVNQLSELISQKMLYRPL
jgi:acyl carrier protein